MFPLLFTAVLALGPVDIQYRPLEGEVVVAQLLELDATHAVLLTEGEQRSVPIASLSSLSITSSESTPFDEAPHRIALVDGSQLLASRYSVTEGLATIELLDGSSVEISTRRILAVRMKPPTPLLDDRWKEIVVREATGDQLVVRRSDEVLDYLEGVVQDVSADKITFILNGTAREVNPERVEGVVYYHRRSEELPPVICLAHDGNGNQWHLQSIELTDAGFAVTTSCGFEYLLPLTGPLELDFSIGNRRYLSELMPESIEWTPFIGGPEAADELRQYFRVRFDCTMEGPLQLYTGEGTTRKDYDHGLHIRSRTELVYRLPRDFHHLRALVGIDARVRPHGSVRLTIRGDGRVLFDELITGELSSTPAENAPRQLDLDITGVSRLDILVDYADEFSWSDHLNLCDLRITK